MKVFLTLVWALTLSIALSAANADAHFIWVRLIPAEGNTLSARACFAETPAPDREELLTKISGTKFRIRDANGGQQALTLNKSGEGDHAELAVSTTAARPCSLEATCDYGVYDLHDRPVLLQYYARAIHAATAADVGRLGPSPTLALDIVPTCESGTIKAKVIWQGKTQAGLVVQISGPDKKRHKLTTDDQGMVSLAVGNGGAFSMLTSYTEAGRTGERNGRKYSAVGHYCTLTIDVPGSPKTDTMAKADAGAAGDPTATELLARARQARAVWDKFPGFTADAVVKVEQREAKGKLTVDGNGRIELQLSELPKEDLAWVKKHLGSLVQHRMPDGSLGNGANFVAESGTHPLGRRIRLEEEVMGSEYRIKDDVVTQVNRQMGKQRLVINVLSVTRNAEGKYLPAVFNVAMWDSTSGNLGGSQTVMHHWVRVGTFDLPCQIEEVDCRTGGNVVKTIELGAHQLTPAK